jgi:DNA-binding CsgD family transcriptional regulator
MAERDAPSLFGRSAERAEAEQVLGAVRDGLSGALVVRGEPGIGKTALLDELGDSAPDLHIVRLAGIESEMQFGYAGLHQLIHPYASQFDALPSRQRAALDVAFGVDTSDTIDRLLIGLATLTLLSTIASAQPLLLMVDDAQWLDRETTEVLAFVARRLHADRVGLILAARETTTDDATFSGIPQLRLTGLHPDDAAALLEHVTGVLVPERVATRLVAETAGNPLALRELGAQLTAAQLAGQAPLPVPLPVGLELEERFIGQARALPPATQTLLLTAAAELTGDPSLLWRAGQRLGFDHGDAVPAIDERMIVVEPRVAFRHPLIRSAVYYLAPDPQRRRVHAALAELLDRDEDPDRWLRHRAAATAQPDEEVASALEASGRNARVRGSARVAADLFAWSATLTLDEDLKRTRILAAAESALTAGDVQAAEEHLARVDTSSSDSIAYAHARRLLGLQQLQMGRSKDAYITLLEASELLAPIDRDQSRDTLLEALDMYMTTRLLAAPEVGSIAPLAAAVASGSGDEQRVRDVLLDGFATRYAVGHPEGAPKLREALDRLRHDDLTTEEVARCSLLGFFAALEVWDDVALDAWSRRVIEVTSAAGALHALRVGMLTNATVRVLLGTLDEAAIQHAEHDALSAVVGEHDNYRFHEVEVLAWQGDEAAMTERADQLIAAHDAYPEFGSLLYVGLNAHAVLALGTGRYEAAVPLLERIFEGDPPRYGCVLLPDMVEAGARGKAPEFAAAALDRLDARATAAATPWARGVLARARALVANDDDAEALYADAIRLLERTRALTDLARAQLAYGEWLRRANRALDAREVLRAALEAFEKTGANAFAERARNELLVAGERTARPAPSAPSALTPQEAQIARMAADRATNQQIASRLFISPNTVDYHLRKIYRKLGITSRRELRGMTVN